MVRPTTIPESPDDLLVEQAAAREALRLALAHHRDLARPLKGVVRQRTIADTFDQAGPEDIVDLSKVDLIIGSGGVLSHAPQRAGAFLMMLDAFQPAGVCHLAVDSIFMMPHLGILSTVDAEAATSIFERDCIVPLGAVVAPFGRSPRRGPLLEASVTLPDGEQREVRLESGDLLRVRLALGEEAEVALAPARGVDIGSGPGRERNATARGGEAGIVFDGRGRPFEPPSDDSERLTLLSSWLEAMGLSARD